ncbi:uncharacterized protein LOC107271105 isoform X2 [Cephus cinctus]|uniref:Gamma-tubulin complex component n=1 Tax=Cephus cinctus TaxID=211228 RepID=A0AAJ7RNC4_CEPCN|nr:uncharacterized protein LOC107271105 isoform X2 [Cephus cinctus]
MNYLQMAFNNILQTFCEYFTMIRKLQDFGNYLKPNYVLQNVYRQPPLTYESYYAVLTWHLTRVKRRIIKIETNFMKQDTCNSFLTLLKDIKKHLETIKILYEIHQAVTSDWKVYPNYKCASRLLSCLYFEMENSNNKEKANISTSLYLSSLRVYLNITDTWLNEGRLEDWRDEFIISRVPINITDVDDFDQREQFTIRGLNAICLKDPIMRLLIDKVSHMGKNIGLLVSLDRLSDIWKMTADGDGLAEASRRHAYWMSRSENSQVRTENCDIL